MILTLANRELFSYKDFIIQKTEMTLLSSIRLIKINPITKEILH